MGAGILPITTHCNVYVLLGQRYGNKWGDFEVVQTRETFIKTVREGERQWNFSSGTHLANMVKIIILRNNGDRYSSFI